MIDGGHEVVADRTATSKTLALPDGLMEKRLYGAPINFQNSDGEWKPIREGFERDGLSLDDRDHPFEIHLPSRLGGGPVHFGGSKHWVSFEQEGPESVPAELEEDGAVAYEVPSTDTNFEYATLPDGLKESIELSDSSSPSTVRYLLAASHGVTPKLEEDGSIAFRTGDGNSVAEIPAPTVAEAGSPVERPNIASYSLTSREAGGWTLALQVDRSWLEEPGRNWPVTVDPTVLANASLANACEIKSRFESNSYCTQQTVSAGAEYWTGLGSGVDVHRALINFNWAELGVPAKAEVQEASVHLYSPVAAVNTSGVELRRLTKAWSTSTANWKCAGAPLAGFCGGGETWTAPGGDFNSEGSEIFTADRGGQAGEWTFSKGLAPVVQGWVEGNVKAGFILKLKEETASESVKRSVTWDTSLAPEPSTRPYLRVVYMPPAPATSKVISPTEGATTARNLKLKAGWGEAGSVSGVTFEFRVGKKEKGKFEPIPVNLVHQGNGEPVKEWPIPATGFEEVEGSFKFETKDLYLDAAHLTEKLQKEGGELFIRATFDGSPGDEGFSEPVEAVVNRITGSAHDAVAEVGPGSLDLETGNLSISDTDVSIPTPISGLEFARTYNTRAPHPVTETEVAEPPSVLGPGWKPSIPVETAGESEWRNISIEVKEGTFQEEVGEYCEVFENEEGEEEKECWPEIVEAPYRFAWAVVTGGEGSVLSFEETSPHTWTTPPELTGWELIENAEGTTFELKDPARDITTFSNKNTGGGSEYFPESVSQPGGSGNVTRMNWHFNPTTKEKQLTKLIAAAAPGLECAAVTSSGPEGCRALVFNYGTVAGNERLTSIEYLAPGYGGPTAVAEYGYNTEGRLVKEWDPRIAPALEETYAYGPNGELTTITPPGQEPWTLKYGTVEEEAGVGRLVGVERASLLASPLVAKTTIAYDVPLTAPTGPYEMGGSEVAQWGQKEVPVEATAIFPPSEVPSSSPPSSWAQATIYYMDSEGVAVNTATPKGGGTANPSISTAETDEFGNVVRELSPDNRLAVMREPEAKREERWQALETKRRYNREGTQLIEETGPLHQVKIAATGEVVEAHLRRVLEYNDKQGEIEWDGTSGQLPAANLPTDETTSASNPERGIDEEIRKTETQYDWTLRKPRATIVDPGTGHLDIKSITVYNDVTGLPIESRQPKEQTSEGKAGEAAGTTKTIYYQSSGLQESIAECKATRYMGLPCRTEPAAQPKSASEGQPKVLVKKYMAYSALGEPTEVIESPGGGTENVRRTVNGYGPDGRQISSKLEGGGTAIRKVDTSYDENTGLPIEQAFSCESGCTSGIRYTQGFGSGGASNGQFAHPADVVLNGQDIWVVDENNNRLEEFNRSGEFIKAVGSAGSGNGQFTHPKAMAFTPGGNFWVADSGNNRLEEFNAAGEFVRSVGSAAGAFSNPEGIAIDAKGRIWVSDTGNGRILELNENGVFLQAIGEANEVYGAVQPTGIAAGPHGEIWVVDSKWSKPRLLKLEEGGGLELEADYGPENFSVEWTEDEFVAPHAIAIDAEGNVWLSEGEGTVQELSPLAVKQRSFGSGSAPTQNFSLQSPTGLSADPEGGVWLTDAVGNRIQRWSPFLNGRDSSTEDYNALGQVTGYEDADGNKTEIHYDVDGRPATVSDNKGTQTYHYNETSGLLTSLEDSGAGTFTATYDADGNLIERSLPNGLTAKTSYNAVDEPTKLAYTKTSSCGESCTWYEENLERSVYGQILTDGNSLATDRYKYDNDGRLKEAQEIPTGGGCTSREYEYDADSNRLSRTVREPGIGGVCATSGGTTQKYSYDAADRLLGTGLTYDAWGRITNLPAEYAGGKALETKFFADNMVASQTQNGVTNSYELDASGRQRQRIQAGGVAGTEIFHYDGPGDSPSWTSLGSTWSRNIVGIGGELAAVQESSGTVTFDLTDLHGDVAATASSSPTATKLLATSRFDEFGERESGGAGRFGWLGGKQRRTELASGVIQMGARSYIPQLGRFLTPDSVGGGSANPYDYADQDPVNAFDLGGTCAYSKWHVTGHCPGQSKGHETRIREVKKKTRAVQTRRDISTPHVTCGGKAGCSAVGVIEHGGSGLSISGLASKLLQMFTNPVQSPGQLTWSNVKTTVNVWLESGANATAQAAYGCAKDGLEAFNEVKPLFGVPGGALPGGGWVLTKCAVGAL